MAKARNTPGLRLTMVAFCRSLAKDLFDPYRPELHYMRGPGPKWHAKHAQPATGTPELGVHGSLRAA